MATTPATDFRAYLSANAPQYLPLVGAGPSGNVTTSYGINPQALESYVINNGNASGNAGNAITPDTVKSDINNLYTAYSAALNAPAATAATPNPDAGPDATIAAQASNDLDSALSALTKSNANDVSQEGAAAANLAGTQAQQQANYNYTLTQDAQGLTDAETGAKTQGNTDLTSLDRLLGSMGAGGSSVETEEIPTLVDRSVASNISGADTTKATDDQTAANAWNTFLSQLAYQQSQLQQSLTNDENTNAADYTKNSQALNQIIAAAKAGSIDPSDLDYELNSAAGAIPAVANWVAPSLAAPPVYTPAPLSAYTLSPSAIAAASGTALPTSGAATIPFLAAITGNQQKTTAPAAT